MEKDQLSFLITQDSMAAGKKEKCTGKDISHGMMVLRIEETINMEENTEWEDSFSAQENTTKGNGFMESKTEKELFSIKITKSFKKESGNKAYISAKMNDNVNPDKN